MVAEAPLHADVAPLGFLLGTWEGRGEGEYPTIDPFPYEERIEIGHVGDAYLTVVETSWAADGAAVHLERGFIRPGLDGEVELVLAHPIGVVEVAHGSADGDAITFRTEPGSVGRTRTGLDVVGLARRYRVVGDELTYEVDMATERTDMTIHLRGVLRRG
jgi:hypothetical protein